MGLSTRRRWLWLFGTLALLGLLIYGVSSMAWPDRWMSRSDGTWKRKPTDA